MKIIAAYNPYKKHADDIIQNFEKSGLGFYVDTNETQEKLGDLPMRHLVYRVQPLPGSMLPIIWDFGQLNDDIETLYISQIVNKRFKANAVNLNQNDIDLIIKLLSASQKFMRNQKNECSFESLRDVQRTLTVIQWFLQNGQIIFKQMAKKQTQIEITDQQESDEDLLNNSIISINNDEELVQEIQNNQFETNVSFKSDIINSIILALNTTYHVGLQNDETRIVYRKYISKSFENPQIYHIYIAEVINNCYEILLDEISLPAAITRNHFF